jgi:uncharacterized protein YdaU (DUF1376 family)
MASKKTNIWMPWYPADYLKDTLDLSLEEDCFYRRTLDQLWIGRGEIPADPERLQRMLRISKKNWKKCEWILIKFCYKTGDVYRNIRIDLEINNANEKAAIARENGKSGGRPITQRVISGLPNNNPDHNPEKSSSSSSLPINTKDQDKSKKEPLKRFQPPTISEIVEYCQERKSRIDPEKFFAYYESNGWRVGRNPMKSWKAAITTWEKGVNQNGKRESLYESAEQRNSRRFREELAKIAAGDNQAGDYEILSQFPETSPGD